MFAPEPSESMALRFSNLWIDADLPHRRFRDLGPGFFGRRVKLVGGGAMLLVVYCILGLAFFFLPLKL